MPEGDTIHTLAGAIAPRLEGRTLRGFEFRENRALDLSGGRVDRVEALGKHLLVTVRAPQGELLLRTHLGMHGSWHRYAVTERWKRPRRQASLVLETEHDVFVCFNAKEAECLRANGRRARELRQHLGPDLLGQDEPDLDDIVQRARSMAEPDLAIADVLLHQGIACGLGNVYKCELLFLHRLHPRRRSDAVDDARLRELYREGRELLLRNVGAVPRVTRDVGDGAGEQWVYGRAGHECLVCGDVIERDWLGKDRRVTYWCPTCQPA